MIMYNKFTIIYIYSMQTSIKDFLSQEKGKQSLHVIQNRISLQQTLASLWSILGDDMPTNEDIDELMQEVSTITQSLEKFVDTHHDTSSELIQSKIQQAQDVIQSLQEIQDFVDHVVQWQNKLPNKQKARTRRLDTITHQLQTFADSDIFSFIEGDTRTIEKLEKEQSALTNALRRSKQLPRDQSHTQNTTLNPRKEQEVDNDNTSPSLQESEEDTTSPQKETADDHPTHTIELKNDNPDVLTLATMSDEENYILTYAVKQFKQQSLVIQREILSHVLEKDCSHLLNSIYTTLHKLSKAQLEKMYHIEQVMRNKYEKIIYENSRWLSDDWSFFSVAVRNYLITYIENLQYDIPTNNFENISIVNLVKFIALNDELYDTYIWDDTHRKTIHNLHSSLILRAWWWSIESAQSKDKKSAIQRATPHYIPWDYYDHKRDMGDPQKYGEKWHMNMTWTGMEQAQYLLDRPEDYGPNAQ